MPIPFLIGIGAAVVGSVAGKVAIGVVAGAIIHSAFSARVTKSVLDEGMKRIMREEEALRRKKAFELRIKNIYERKDYTELNIGLYEEEKCLKEVSMEAKKGIDRSDIYVGRSWMVYC